MHPNSQSRRILVVDDEPSIVDAVATSLRYEGFDVAEATTGRGALDSVQERAPDLIVLDIMLPDFDGLEVTRRLRARGVEAPVLFLTARDAIRDRLAGLSVGADDYVTKPFALAQLVARVHAILRRTAGEAAGDQPLRFADLEMDESIHEVRRAGVPIALTATEYSLLRFFVEPAPRGLEDADPRSRLALRLSRQRERGRDLRGLPAQEARPAWPAPDPHDPPGRLHLARRHGVGRQRCRCAAVCCSPSAPSLSWRSSRPT